MKVKRQVSKNLGRTQHGRADLIYAEISARRGPTRRCPYRGRRGEGRVENMHDILNPTLPNPNIPIEEFDFLKKGEHWDLQTYCKVCHKHYRSGRAQEAHAHFDPMSDIEIRAWYRDNVAATMRCSVCHKEKVPDEFGISRGMEKGLHNECLLCQSARGASVREQEWLAEGDWASWTTAVLKMRRRKKIRCAGWSLSVAGGTCKKVGTGKSMHADHRVPLRAGGIHDSRNFQALCSTCNTRKSDQIDPLMRQRDIVALVGAAYRGAIRRTGSIQTNERRLKNALVLRIAKAIGTGTYAAEIAALKKRVNGQWDTKRAFKKGVAWFKRYQKGLEE